jgi:hypothetical protein
MDPLLLHPLACCEGSQESKQVLLAHSCASNNNMGQLSLLQILVLAVSFAHHSTVSNNMMAPFSPTECPNVCLCPR